MGSMQFSGIAAASRQQDDQLPLDGMDCPSQNMWPDKSFWCIGEQQNKRELIL